MYRLKKRGAKCLKFTKASSDHLVIAIPTNGVNGINNGLQATEAAQGKSAALKNEQNHPPLSLAEFRES
jgi:hypothetical protein